jgi:hypothetical protein
LGEGQRTCALSLKRRIAQQNGCEGLSAIGCSSDSVESAARVLARPNQAHSDDSGSRGFDMAR